VTVRSILLAASLVALGAQAQGVPQTIDLDKPGALAALEKAKPDHYRAVIERVSQVERMNCAPAPGMLRAKRPAEHERCHAYLIGTSYPAKVHLLVPVEQSRYVITAYVDPSQDRLLPAR
jgi:hypothetical protein